MGEICLRAYRFDTNVKFVLYSTNFELKTTLSAILLWQVTYRAEEYSFLQGFFVLNEVSMLARQAGLVRLHGQI